MAGVEECCLRAGELLDGMAVWDVDAVAIPVVAAEEGRGVERWRIVLRSEGAGASTTRLLGCWQLRNPLPLEQQFQFASAEL